jgi:ABC-type multidrug transport system fused ATPase/permease subunit
MNIIGAARKRWRQTIMGRSLRVLSRSDQRKILAVVIIQIFMGLLDLAGVAAIGVLGALAVSGVASKQTGNRVNEVLDFLNLAGQTFQFQAAVLGLLAAGLLISRTIFSIWFTRRTLYFLSRRGARISSSLISKLLNQSLLQVQHRTTQETLYAVTRGVDSITLGVIGITITLISDTSLLLVMFTGLFIVDPKIALSTLVVFGLIGFSLYKLMHKYARRLGLAESELTIGVNEKIVEVLVSYRESVVRNRRYYYSKEIEKSKYRLSNTLADISFLPSITKYVIETTVVIGTLAISVVLFLSQDATRAVATLAVFMASVTRIAPAVMRIQQGAIAIRQSLGTAQPTLELIESLQEDSELDETENLLNTEHHGFQGIVELKQLSFKYPTKQDPVLKSIDLKVKEGEFLAIVGSSGAGKTTLVDVILGVLKQDSGEIYISGKPPLDSIKTWPGAISYVPQDVVISSGNIRENVSLGFPSSEVHDAMVWRALETAQLSEFVKQLPFGLETQVGERGTKLSGGQRQRLGIARAMFTQPKLLVLDEATSSLDGQTEADISEAIQSLKGSVTIIMIAHRLSTVRNASRVIYMSEGSVLASGTFDEVRKLVPDFDRQASLMGLR